MIITIDKTDEYPSLGKFRCSITLEGTAAETIAPLGKGTANPYVVGYGASPASALGDAYKRLGEHIVNLEKTKGD